MPTTQTRDLTASALRIAAEVIRRNPIHGLINSVDVAIEILDHTALIPLTLDQRTETFQSALVAIRTAPYTADRPARLTAAADMVAADTIAADPIDVAAAAVHVADRT